MAQFAQEVDGRGQDRGPGPGDPGVADADVGIGAGRGLGGRAHEPAGTWTGSLWAAAPVGAR